MIDQQLSTGLPGLDRVLRGVMPGDNFVWQVESLADFTPFAASLLRSGGGPGEEAGLLPLRRARAAACRNRCAADVRRLRRPTGFEPFVTEVHRVVQEAGPETHFVFDCLSNLVDVWLQRSDVGQLLHAHLPRPFASAARWPISR